MNPKSLPVLVVFNVLLLALANPAFMNKEVLAAQVKKTVLSGEFPVDLAPPPGLSAFSDVADPRYKPGLPDKEAAAQLLAEARWVFAGMIWGFDYVYTPSDKARGIAEFFEIKPRWTKNMAGNAISRDASVALDIRPLSVSMQDAMLYAYLECSLGAEEASEQASWAFGTSHGQARGTAAYFRLNSEDPLAVVLARRKAIINASKEALRAILRDRTHNKPREVRGSFAFAAVPKVIVKNGEWLSTARILTREADIESYGAY
ncbi:hypothetical protein MASR2M29_23740 [Spirochaetota bacterium]